MSFYFPLLFSIISVCVFECFEEVIIVVGLFFLLCFFFFWGGGCGEGGNGWLGDGLADLFFLYSQVDLICSALSMYSVALSTRDG